MGTVTTRLYRRLFGKIADKREDDERIVTNWLRTKISFCLLRSALLCIRGSRRQKLPDLISFKDTDVKLAAEESKI